MRSVAASSAESAQSSWPSALKHSRFRLELLTTLALLAFSLFLLSRFLAYVEQRPGVVLPDPVLSIFTPTDVTWITFSVIYAGLALALIHLFSRPSQMLLAFQAYIMLIVLRIMVMALTPLDAPPGLIVLADPFVEFFVGHGSTLTKDLFFSGHTSTLFLLFLVARGRRWKMFFLMCAVVVAFCVLIQHVHYTIDVIIAPGASYCAYRSLQSVRELFRLD
jgi:hypothetical protein